MSAKYSKILIVTAILFIITILVGVTASVVFTVEKSGSTARAANISHYVVPILFYPADVTTITQAEIDKVGVAMDAARYWYGQRGQTFEYLKDPSTLKVRVYKGLHNKDYYESTGLGSQHIIQNIYNEIAEHERLSLHTFGSPDTSFGWWDRATLVFMKGIPYAEKPPSHALAYSSPFRSRGGYSSFPSMVLDTLMHDYSTCNSFSDLNGANADQRSVYCADNTQYGTIIHEIGHAIAGLDDLTDKQIGGDACGKDIMCGGAFDIQNANFNTGDISKVQNSPFTNPPEIGSAEYNSYVPTDVMKRFCFESTDPGLWCNPSSPVGGIPVSPGESGFNFTVKSGGDCNAYGCVGPSLSTSWSNVTYRVELKCTYGAYCADTWNQWVTPPGCGSWPMGTCPPYDTTNNYVDILASSGFQYKYRVWIITKKDGDVNNVAAYLWVGETSVNNTCSSGTCSVRLNWPKVTYDTNLTLNGLIENGQPVNVCRGNWVDPATGVSSPCESAWSGTSNSHTFTQLNTSITADLYVQVKDVNGASHLLQTKQNVGTTANTCTGGYCQCTCNAASIPGGTNHSLMGTAGSQSVTLAWAVPSSWGQECGGNSAREYLIKFDTVNPPSPNPLRTANLSLTLNNLKPGTTYYYQISVQNKGGKVSDYSAVKSFTTLPVSSPSPSPTPTPSPPPPVPPVCTFTNSLGKAQKYGDIDNNGTIDSADVNILNRIIADITNNVTTIVVTADIKKAADVNGDGVINGGDALAMNRFVAGLISRLPVCLCTFINSLGKAQKYGDIDNSGAIDSADADLLNRIIANLTPPTVTADIKKAADVNGDGVINGGDALAMNRFVAGLISKFPVCP